MTREVEQYDVVVFDGRLGDRLTNMQSSEQKLSKQVDRAIGS